VQQRHRWLIVIVALLFVAGLACGCWIQSSLADQMAVFALAAWPLYVCTYCWMKADALSHARAPPPGAIPFIPLFLAAAVPYYLIATRRRWSRLSSMILLFAYVGVAATFVELGGWIGRKLVT